MTSSEDPYHRLANGVRKPDPTLGRKPDDRAVVESVPPAPEPLRPAEPAHERPKRQRVVRSCPLPGLSGPCAQFSIMSTKSRSCRSANRLYQRPTANRNGNGSTPSSSHGIGMPITVNRANDGSA